jgi:branched-chain amino acid transport system ATP-binding protein
MTDASPPIAGVAALLTLDQVSSGYTDEPIVTDFSIDIPAESITTIIGPNGAGKSTLLRTIYGTIRHFGGTIRLAGEPIETLRPRERLARGIGFVPQGRCNFPMMTVRENLEMGAFTVGAAQARAAIDRMLGLFPMLAAKLKVLAGNLSGGEQQILETAMVLETAPRLLLLDEPSLGLSPVAQDQVFTTVGQLRDSGLTVLIVEQNAHGALQISDTGIVMELGRLAMTGPAATLAADPRVRKAYLGG